MGSMAERGQRSRGNPPRGIDDDVIAEVHWHPIARVMPLVMALLFVPMSLVLLATDGLELLPVGFGLIGLLNGLQWLMMRRPAARVSRAGVAMALGRLHPFWQPLRFVSWGEVRLEGDAGARRIGADDRDVGVSDFQLVVDGEETPWTTGWPLLERLRRDAVGDTAEPAVEPTGLVWMLTITKPG